MFKNIFQAAIDPSHLLIALEPEAASIYCKHIDLANFSGMAANFKPFASGSRYIILDAGGNDFINIFVSLFLDAISPIRVLNHH